MNTFIANGFDVQLIHIDLLFHCTTEGSRFVNVHRAVDKEHKNGFNTVLDVSWT